MNFLDLPQNISSNVYILKGDAFLCKQVQNKIATNFNISPINISVFNDENFDVLNVLNACNQFSFFDEKRMVVVSDIAKELSQDFKLKLEKYCNNPNPNCTLIFVDTISSGVFDFLKNVEIVLCKPSENYIVNYIKQKFEYAKKTISLQDCKKIGEYCLGDLNRINNEIKKICDFLGQESNVDGTVIDVLVYKDTELKVFDLTNALGLKNLNESLKVLNDMLLSGEAPIKILSLITGMFRRMMFAKINKSSPADLAKVLGVKEFAMVKAKQYSEKFTAGQLKKIMNLLLEADYNIKSGQMTQENVLVYLVCKIVA